MDRCAEPYLPGIYSRVSGDIDWIRSTICELTHTNQDFCDTNSYEPTPSPTYDYGALPTIDDAWYQPTADDNTYFMSTNDTLIHHSNEAKASKNGTSSGGNDSDPPTSDAKNHQTSIVNDRKPQPKVAKDPASKGNSRKLKRT
jgi:hypothetical protein